jgi:hypothetical protein
MIAFPTLFTMALAGVWHGAGLQFLIFGLLHGVYLSVNHAWRQFGPRRAQPARGLTRAGYVLLTFLCVMFAQIFFRADSTGDAVRVIAGMFGLHGLESPAPLAAPLHALFHADPAWSAGDLARLTFQRWGQGLLIAVLLAFVWLAPNANQIANVYSPALEGPAAGAPRWLQWRPTLAWTAVCVIVLVYAMLNLQHTARFLYFQF